MIGRLLFGLSPCGSFGVDLVRVCGLYWLTRCVFSLTDNLFGLQEFNNLKI